MPHLDRRAASPQKGPSCPFPVDPPTPFPQATTVLISPLGPVLPVLELRINEMIAYGLLGAAASELERLPGGSNAPAGLGVCSDAGRGHGTGEETEAQSHLATEPDQNSGVLADSPQVTVQQRGFWDHGSQLAHPNPQRAVGLGRGGGTAGIFSSSKFPGAAGAGSTAETTVKSRV